MLELAGALDVFTSGSISDKIGRRKMLFIIKVITPLMMMLFLLTKGFWQLPILFVLGLFSFASSPITMALVQENVRGHPAAANGVLMTLRFMFGAASVWICAVLSLVGIPCSLLLPKDHKIDEGEANG